jgi:serine/threonine protein kinase/type II secretory pathway predicted ATPase ExeA
MPFQAFPGSEIAGYTIRTELGKGGMATVYLADHPRLGRRVALKLLADELSDDADFRERFGREAKIAAALEHPNVVPVYDAGEWEGVLFIAMRFVDGTDLKELLRREAPIEVERALDVVSQVAAALDAAHARGLVHRDVKPANVLLDPGAGAGGKDHAYLADFGLARTTLPTSAETKAGELYGTLDYMAPEQLEGRPVDARTDVYALTCVLYECLTGAPPFQRRTAVATAAAHLHEEPDPASRRRSDLGEDLDRVLARGLRKAKADRYGTCSELIRETRRALLAHLSIEEAHGISPLETAVRGAPPEERKVVTVLFCDLSGLASRLRASDPEEARALMRPHREFVRQEIQGHGGTVESSVADTVMAVFGAPVAHEDDADRAIRAGLRIIDHVVQLPEARDIRSALQIGIDTGEALVSFDDRRAGGDASVSGNVVTLALQVQRAAPANGMAVGDVTRRTARAAFEFASLPIQATPGEPQASPVWQVAVLQRMALPDFSTGPRPAPSMVGRELERNALIGALDRCVRDASVQLVTIVGEPGIGKTRLLNDLLEVATKRDVHWRRGRCLPYGDGITFWALGEIVKSEAGILESDPPETAASKIDVAVPDDHPDAPWLRQRLKPLVGLEAPTAARDENFAAWRAFLESVAERGPLVLAIEDLHWADPALLEFVEHLVEYSEGVPILIVSTTRPELYERAHAFAQSARNATRINLTPLSDDETADLVLRLLDAEVLPERLKEAILQRASGNPLYAEEFIHLLKDTGTLRREEAEWVLDPDEDIPIPAGVQGLIAARLDTLSPDQKSLLHDAAVVGRTFWAGAIAEMGARDSAAVSTALRELSRRELIRAVRQSSMSGEKEYIFWHALVRDGCYGQIPRNRRIDKHRSAATWIERVAGERAEDLADILASHYVTALELAEATGTRALVQELSTSARRFLMLAGDRALILDATAAEANFRRALRLASHDDLDRSDILARLGVALRLRAKFVESDAAFEEAIARYREIGNLRAAAVAMARRAPVLYRLGSTRYLEVQSEASSLLEPLPPDGDTVFVLTEFAGALMNAGDNRRAIEVAERTCAVAQALGLPEPASAVGYRGVARFSLGDPAGVDDLRRAADLTLAQGRGLSAAVSRGNLANALRAIEGPGAASIAYQEAVDFAERRGIEEVALGCACERLEPMVDRGLLDEVLAAAPALARRAEASGDVPSLLRLRVSTLRVLNLRGQLREAGAIVDWVVETARKLGDAQLIGSALPAAAALAHSTHEDQTARDLLLELESTPNVKEDLEYVINLPGSVRSAIGIGEAELARALTAGVEPLHPLHRYALASAYGLLAEADRDAEAAVAHFASAADDWERFGVPMEAAHAFMGLSRVLVILGRHEQAAGPRRRADGLFAVLKTTQLST